MAIKYSIVHPVFLPLSLHFFNKQKKYNMLGRFYAYLSLIVVCLLIPYTSYGEREIIRIPDTTISKVNVCQYGLLLKDPKVEFIPGDSILENDSAFSKIEGTTLYDGYPAGAIWVKLRIQNPTNPSVLIRFPIGFMPTRFFQKNGNSYKELESIGYKFPTFALPLTDGPTDYLMRIKGDGKLMRFPLTVLSVEENSSEMQKIYYLLSAYYGILLFIMGLNIYYYYSLKAPIFGIYAIYTFINIVVSLNLDGMIYQIFKDHEVILDHITFIMIRGLFGMLLIVSKILFQFKTKAPKLDKICNYFLFYYLGLMTLAQFIVPAQYAGFFHFMSQYNSLGATALLVFLIIRASKYSLRIYKYYLLGIGLFVVGLIIHVINLSTGTFALLVTFPFKMGALAEIVMLSYTISLSFHHNKKKHQEQAQRIENEKRELLLLHTENLQQLTNPEFLNYILDYLSKEDVAYDTRLELLDKTARLSQRSMNNLQQAFVPIEEEVNLMQNFKEVVEIISPSISVSINEKINDKDIELPPSLVRPCLDELVFAHIAGGKGKSEMEVSYEENGNRVFINVRHNIHSEGGAALDALIEKMSLLKSKYQQDFDLLQNSQNEFTVQIPLDDA